MNEEWRAVKGYEGLYEVSNMGRVRSLDHVTRTKRNGIEFDVPKRGKILTPLKRQHGYLGVQLYGKGGHESKNMRTLSVHRLVAEAFIPNPNNLPEVNHKDENKQNNCLDNLEWISHRDNTLYGNAQVKKIRRGAENKRSKPIIQLTKNGEFVRRFECISDVKAFGYATGNIVKCAKGDAKYHHAYGYLWRYAL